MTAPDQDRPAALNAGTRDRLPLIFAKVAPFFRTGSVYLLFSIINRAIPFLLLPVLTRYIDPAGYGTVAVLTVVTGLAMPVIGMCSNSVLFQRYFKLNQADRVYFVNDSYKLFLLVGAIISLVAIPCSPLILKHLKISLMWFEVAILCAAAGMVTTMTTSLFQIKKKAASYGFFQTALMLANVGLTLLLVVYLEMSWQGRIWAILASGLLFSFVAVALNVRSGDVQLESMGRSPQMRTIVRLGGALIPSTVTGWAISMSDRFFLTSMTTLEVVGIYSVGVMMAQITNVFLDSLGQAYLPHLYKHGYSDDDRILVRVAQGIYLVVIVSLLVALAVTLIAPLAIGFMVDPRYHAATKVVGWISLSYAFISIGAAFQGLILSIEKNHVTIYVSGVTLVVSLMGNYFLIGRFSIVGAAMANALSSFTSMALLFIASLRYNRVPWFDRRVFGLN